MTRRLRFRPIWGLALGLIGLVSSSSVSSAQEKAVAPTGGAVAVTVSTAAPAPPVSIVLHERHGHVTPIKGKCTHTGGGLIDVAQPGPDTVIITMTGAVLSNASMQFDLQQCFEVSFDDPRVKRAKLSVEGRVVGVLRGHFKGCAEYTDATASITCGPSPLVMVSVPTHQACGCDSLGVNDHDGPKLVPAVAAKYVFHQTFNIAAHSDCFLAKKPSAEFAPDPSLDPLWISYFDPFHGVNKQSFGFQVVLKVIPDTDPPVNGEKK